MFKFGEPQKKEKENALSSLASADLQLWSVRWLEYVYQVYAHFFSIELRHNLKQNTRRWKSLIIIEVFIHTASLTDSATVTNNLRHGGRKVVAWIATFGEMIAGKQSRYTLKLLPQDNFIILQAKCCFDLCFSVSFRERSLLCFSHHATFDVVQLQHSKLIGYWS